MIFLSFNIDFFFGKLSIPTPTYIFKDHSDRKHGMEFFVKMFINFPFIKTETFQYMRTKWTNLMKPYNLTGITLGITRYQNFANSVFVLLFSFVNIIDLTNMNGLLNRGNKVHVCTIILQWVYSVHINISIEAPR